MNRSKKIIILANCILNSNAKVFPLATYNGVLFEAIEGYIKEGTGLLQLPCPESSYLGMNRWGMSKDQYDNPGYRNHCKEILRSSLDQIENFINAGYEIVGVVGVDGSPSCGILKTPTGLKGGVPGSDEKPFENIKYSEASGVFMDVFKEMLLQRKIQLKFMAIDEHNPSKIME